MDMPSDLTLRSIYWRKVMDFDPNEKYDWKDEVATDIALAVLFVPIIYCFLRFLFINS